MFEREIKFIYDFNLNKLNKYGSFFSFGQLRESDIHPAILQYISAELDYLIFEDRQKLVKDSIFDYSGEKIAKYFSFINEELKKNKRLSSDYVAKILLHSISFNVNFLVRPKWALTKFIYEDESHRTAAEIKQILNYLHFYKYLKKVIIDYLNTRKIISMNSAEFIELLNKIDEASMQSDYAGVMLASLKAMAEFFNIGGVQKSKIPYNAIQAFLEDKGLDAPLARFREEYSEEIGARVELNDILNLLTAFPSERVEAEPLNEKDEVFEEDELPISRPFEEEIEIEENKETDEGEPVDDTGIGAPASAPQKDEIPEKEKTTASFHFNEEDLPPIKINYKTKEEIAEVEQADEKEETGEMIEKFFSEKEDEEEPEPGNEEDAEKEAEPDIESIVEEKEVQQQPEIPAIEKEVIIEKGNDDDDDWDFVEDEEHDDIIKEIADFSPEETAKKGKAAKKKYQSDEDEEPNLFEGEEKSFSDFLKDEETAINSKNVSDKSFEAAHRDFTKLLEHKEMAKIIDVLFDCDIEEVELMLNSLSFFNTYPEAENFIDRYFLKLGVKPDSREALAFKDIIKQNYEKGNR